MSVSESARCRNGQPGLTGGPAQVRWLVAWSAPDHRWPTRPTGNAGDGLACSRLCPQSWLVGLAGRSSVTDSPASANKPPVYWVLPHYKPTGNCPGCAGWGIRQCHVQRIACWPRARRCAVSLVIVCSALAGAVMVVLAPDRCCDGPAFSLRGPPLVRLAAQALAWPLLGVISFSNLERLTPPCLRHAALYFYLPWCVLLLLPLGRSIGPWHYLLRLLAESALILMQSLTLFNLSVPSSP